MSAEVGLRAINVDRETVLAEALRRADNFLSRAKGLMGAGSLAAGRGLYLDGDNAIHTCFMRFPIDVAFVDSSGQVLHLIPRLKPWRASRIIWHARGVFELPAGTIERTRTRVGDHIRLTQG
jgi:uncharacterized membrane protein (UPF0127 family)